MRTGLRIAATLTALFAAPSLDAGATETPRGYQLIASAQVSAPQGVLELCALRPSACSAGSAQASAPPPGDDVRIRELFEVNRAVNREVRPLDDRLSAGLSDRWSLPGDQGMVGDCEDFALEKRRRLIARGWPEQSLRIAIADVPRLGQHAVLVVTTSRGDLVLDNRFDRPAPIERLRYRWLATHQPGQLTEWAAAYVARSPL